VRVANGPFCFARSNQAWLALKGVYCPSWVALLGKIGLGARTCQLFEIGQMLSETHTMVLHLVTSDGGLFSESS